MQDKHSSWAELRRIHCSCISGIHTRAVVAFWVVVHLVLVLLALFLTSRGSTGHRRVYAPRSDHQQNTTRHIGYTSAQEHPICSFLRSGTTNLPREEVRWGPYDQCNMTLPSRWLRTAAGNCYSCVTGANVCTNPPLIIYHMYMGNLHPTRWEGNLLSLKSYLMTQDLQHTQLWLWTDAVPAIYNAHNKAFFDTHQEHIHIKYLDYQKLVKATEWEYDPVLGNVTVLKQQLARHARKCTWQSPFSDLLRVLLPWHYGGFWMDNDTILLHNLHPLLSVAYQFTLRWQNNHVMMLHQGSPLARRLMHLARLLRLEDPNFYKNVIERICIPAGYFQVVPEDYGFGDLFNFCLFRLAMRDHNTGPPNAVLYDMPLGWWDQHWTGCSPHASPVTEPGWQYLAGNYLAMHTRYPKKPQLVPGDPVTRAKALIDAFFSQCKHAECIPSRGADLLDFQGMPIAVASSDGTRPGSIGSNRSSSSSSSSSTQGAAATQQPVVQVASKQTATPLAAGAQSVGKPDLGAAGTTGAQSLGKPVSQQAAIPLAKSVGQPGGAGATAGLRTPDQHQKQQKEQLLQQMQQQHPAQLRLKQEAKKP